MNHLKFRPQKSSYSNDQPSGVIQSKLEGPSTVGRAGVLGSWWKVNVQWSLNPTQYTKLQQFYRWSTLNGNPKFQIDLPLRDASTYDTVTACLLPDTFEVMSMAGDSYIIKAQLEIDPTTVSLLPSNTTFPGAIGGDAGGNGVLYDSMTGSGAMPGHVPDSGPTSGWTEVSAGTSQYYTLASGFLKGHQPDNDSAMYLTDGLGDDCPGAFYIEVKVKTASSFSGLNYYNGGNQFFPPTVSFGVCNDYGTFNWGAMMIVSPSWTVNDPNGSPTVDQGIQALAVIVNYDQNTSAQAVNFDGTTGTLAAHMDGTVHTYRAEVTTGRTHVRLLIDGTEIATGSMSAALGVMTVAFLEFTGSRYDQNDFQLDSVQIGPLS